MKQINKDILIIAEHDNHALKKATYHTVSAAKQFPGQITIVVAGQNCEAVAKTCATLAGVDQVLLVQDPLLEQGLAEPMAEVIVSIGKAFQTILGPATTFGKNILPRAAALLGVAMISEITQVLKPDTFVRPIYAGNALATVQSLDPIKVISIRPTAFAPTAVKNPDENTAHIENVSVDLSPNLVEFVKRQDSVSKRPELTSARVVVAGGRGLQSGENFKLIEEVADKLGAAIGASRAAVDAGYVPNDYQVGQTGKIVAPELYIAVGISGAIQHLAGMKDSKVIVAINKDADAPIFQVADYGIVGDLFVILPQLSQELASRSGK